MAFIGDVDLSRYAKLDAKLDAELTLRAFRHWKRTQWWVDGPFEFETRRRSKPKYGRGGRRKRQQRNAQALREELKRRQDSETQQFVEEGRSLGAVCYWGCGW